MGKFIQSNYNDKQFYSVAELQQAELVLTDVLTLIGTSGYVRYYTIVAGGTGVHDGVSYIDLNNGLQAELFLSIAQVTLTDTDNNVYIGDSALGNITATYGDNVAIGTQSMRDMEEGVENIAIGSDTMLTGYDSSGCIAIGHEAIYSDDSSSDSIGIGGGVLYDCQGAVNSVVLGTDAMANCVYPQYSIVMGHSAALNYNDSEPIVAIGDNALRSSIDDERNTAVGHRAGYSINQQGSATQGNFNVIMGYHAARYGSAHDRSVIIGYEAGGGNSSNTSSMWDSVAIGYQAAYGGGRNSQSYNQIAIGYQSLYSMNSTHTTAESNLAIGNRALYSAQNAGKNTVVGNGAGDNIVGGDTNTIFGHDGGVTIVNGVGNVVLGYASGPTALDISNKLYIDNSQTDTPLIYGDFSLDYLKINGGLLFDDDSDRVTNNGEIQIIAASDTTIRIIHQGSDGTKRTADITVS